MRHFLGLAALAAVASSLESPAHAALQIAATIGATNFFCQDNDATCDTNPAVGVLQLSNGTFGGLQINGSIQSSPGTPANPAAIDVLNTSSLSIINTLGVSVTVTVAVSDTSFAGPVTRWNTAGSGLWQTADGSKATLNWFADTANAQGADTATDTPGTLIHTFSHTADGTADSFSQNGSGTVSIPGVFSMTEQIVGTIAAGGQLLNRGQTEILSLVPEPASMALFAAGLLGMGLLGRRHR